MSRASRRMPDIRPYQWRWHFFSSWTDKRDNYVSGNLLDQRNCWPRYQSSQLLNAVYHIGSVPIANPNRDQIQQNVQQNGTIFLFLLFLSIYIQDKLVVFWLGGSRSRSVHILVLIWYEVSTGSVSILIFIIIKLLIFMCFGGFSFQLLFLSNSTEFRQSFY